MSKHKAARHRAPRRTPLRALRRPVALTGIAATATGLVVAGGVLVSTVGPAPAADLTAAQAGTASRVSAGSSPSTLSDEELAARREAPLSRSDRRAATDPAKVAALDVGDTPAETISEDLSDADPRAIGRALLAEYGFGAEQFSCLDSLYLSESGWRVDADNPSSSAYGIPQALPGSKMATAGADWATNPVTQIRWGLGYIRDRYGTPCGAWSFKQSNNWY